MSTEVAAAILALAGVIAVVAVSWVFYRIGRAEDREREAARKPRPPEPEDQNGHRSPGLARERSRRGPPRRPG
ncbi:MAG: hypothetical protein ACRDPC_21405 [Solirubrobacteraceae bacterium]